MTEEKALQQKGSEKLGEMPVHRPVSIYVHSPDDSMMIQSLYNMVDSYFCVLDLRGRADGGIAGCAGYESDVCGGRRNRSRF